jgi:dihydrolipoamide dehydrogenase
MERDQTTLLILGGGPGGYVAAIRAAGLGVPTVLVDADGLGGTCLNIGCIPSKALIHVADSFHGLGTQAEHSPFGIRAAAPTIDLAQAVAWKDGIVRRLGGGVAALLKKHGVRALRGWGRIIDGKTVEVTGADGGVVRIGCEHLLLATGSEPAALPDLPFGGSVVSSTEALSPASLPRHLAVVGGGYIGLELGMAYRKLGVQVSVIEAGGRILPAWDAELTRPVVERLQHLGMALHLEATVLGPAADGQGVRMQHGGGQETVLEADRVLVAVGRRPRTDGFGLESLMLDMNGRAVRTDNQCRTSMRNVWAIGDVTGEPMLAHRAMAQGGMVAEVIAGKRRRFVPAAIPAVCYTDPEVVAVGLGPQEAAQQGLDVVSANFPFAANGRALTLDAPAGFVRVVARRDDHLIVGWQAVGAQVSELAAAFVQTIELGAQLEDIAGTIHAHPTLGEAMQEAALKALGQGLHG